MKVGFIGLGKMGFPMAERLLGYFDLYVHNRTKAKTEQLIEQGAVWCSSPRTLAEKVDVIIIMVSDNSACEAVLIEEDGIFLADNTPIIVNCSTISSSASSNFESQAREMGFKYVAAPVSGTVGPAREGTLTVLIGGNAHTINEVRDVLERFGTSLYEFDTVGDESKVKLLININLAVQTAILGETLTIANQLKIDLDKFLQIVNDSAVSTIISKVKGPNMVKNKYPTAFPYLHMIKDLRYGLELGDMIDKIMPLTSLTKELYLSGIELGDYDFSAIYQTYLNLQTISSFPP